MEGGQAETILWVQALLGKFAPWLDVAGHKQARDIDAGDATFDVIGVEHGLSEELLAAAHLHRGGGLGGAGRRCDLDFLAGEEIHFLGLVLGEQVMKQFFTFDAELGGVLMEFVPHLAVLIRSTLKPFDSPRLLDGIKGCEIAELHGEAAGVPAHLGGDFDDDGIALVKLAEGELAIEVQGDEGVLSRPFY